MYCTQCPIFSTKSRNEPNYHTALKHSAPKPNVPFNCKLCYQEFSGFYALRQHRNTQDGMQIGSRTRDVDVEHIVGDVEDHSLREELRSCQHFVVESELLRARHKIFNYGVETPNETIVKEKLDHFFNNLKCAAKVNLAFGFTLKIIEDGGFRYFYAHEKKYLAGSIQTCVHPWRLGKVERLSPRLLRYINHICYVNNTNAVYQSFRCPHCDNLFKKKHSIWSDLELHAVNVWKKSFRRTYIKHKKLCLTRWTLSELNTLMSNHYSRT